MPKIDLEAIETHLRAAREEERRVRVRVLFSTQFETIKIKKQSNRAVIASLSGSPKL